MKNIDKIFKSYDIRGISGKEVTEELAYAVANAFAQEQELKKCVVSRDVRENSPALAKEAIRGLQDAGCEVINAGITSTSQLKWIVAEKQLPAGMMITASHNPKEYNGFKFYLKEAQPYAQADGMHELKKYLDKPKTGGKKPVHEHDYTQEYINNIMKTLPSSQREVFLDPSGAAACKEVKTLAESGDYNFVLYNAEEDPTFSEHEPNPLEPNATQAARDYCAMNNCIGCVLDADADRLILIDEKGQTVSADFLLALLAKQLPEKSGVCATLNCSWAVKDTCKQKKHTFKRIAVGSANVQRAMKDYDLELGGEKSGHIMFKHTHGVEAPLLCLLEVMKNYDNLSEALQTLRDTYRGSEEKNYSVDNREAVIEKAKEYFAQEGEMDFLDGVYVQTNDWWVCIRPSNTEELIRFTWEAQDQEQYQKIKEQVEAFIEPFIQE